MKSSYKILFVIPLLLLVLIPAISAQNYYADIIVDVHEDGKVDITGSSNYPSFPILGSEVFTSKTKQFWLINISVNDSFTQYIAKIKLPQDASLNYLQAKDVLSIREDNGRIVVTITGKDQPLQIVVQYSFEKKDNSLVFFLFIPVFGLLAGVACYFYFKKRKKRIPLNLDALTKRQKQIVEVLQENKGSLTQVELEKKLLIPKASLSRNIRSLVRKNMITKEPYGMTNKLTLKTDVNP